VDDAIKATVAAGIKPEAEGGIFNIGTDVETPVKELAETLIKVSGAKSSIKFVPKESVYGKSYEDIQRRVPQVERMNKILGVQADTPLEEGLKKTWEWFKENPNW
jgi:UDP-glucose 4-epimerase